MVLAGVEGAPPSHCGNGDSNPPITAIESTPLTSEKPYITIGSDGRYSLVVPPLRTNAKGVDFDTGAVIDFSQVYVTSVSDTATIINAKLAAGLHVVLSPAIYLIDTPLLVNTPGQVVLGLGFATLVSTAANTVIQVGNVDGVRLAGLLVQAGPLHHGRIAPNLIQWGDGSHPGNAKHPSFMHDVFARVGGPDGTPKHPVGVEVMVAVHSGHVIGDDMWLWRADHSVDNVSTDPKMNFCQTGMVITGDNVIMYGLAIEHALGDQMQWSGENGRAYFFQSELPYGVTQAYGDAGYTGYRVNSTVHQHAGWGIGVYSFFRDHTVTVESGIVVPPGLAKNFVAPLSVFLNGHGSIEHVINDKGQPSTKAQQVSYVCGPTPPTPPAPPTPSPPPSPPSPTPTPPTPPAPPTPPKSGCKGCTAVQCKTQSCPKPAYVCLSGSATGGCSTDAAFWPAHTADCTECCDASACSGA